MIKGTKLNILGVDHKNVFLGSEQDSRPDLTEFFKSDWTATSTRTWVETVTPATGYTIPALPDLKAKAIVIKYVTSDIS
jgi:hypothetical protein